MVGLRQCAKSAKPLFDRKRREAWCVGCGYRLFMSEMRQIDAPMQAMPDADACWNAFLRRDRGFDGRFVGAVLTTGIYCKPSCAARHPRRENMIFLAAPAAARAAGFGARLRGRAGRRGGGG